MFNIKELRKLFKYNYKNFFINMKPHDNERSISSNTFNNILTSVILLLIGYSLYVLVLLMAIPIVSSINVNYLGIGSKISFFSILLTLFPIGVLSYTLVNRNKNQTGKAYFIILIIAMVLLMFFLFRLITFIGLTSLNITLGVFGFISFFCCLLGYGFLFVGIIDYLILLKRDYLNLTIMSKKVEIKTSTIDVNDISMH